MDHKFQTQIDRLELVINNWDELSSCGGRFYKIYTLDGEFVVDTKHGLCTNCKINLIGKHLFNELLVSWKYYTGDSWYPIGYAEEYMCTPNKFTNERRLDLAKHSLDFLKKVG